MRPTFEVHGRWSLVASSLPIRYSRKEAIRITPHVADSGRLLPAGLLLQAVSYECTHPTQGRSIPILFEVGDRPPSGECATRWPGSVSASAGALNKM